MKCARLIFGLLFVVSIAHCMQNEHERVAKRQRIERPKYPAIQEKRYVPFSVVRNVVKQDLSTVYSSHPSDNRLNIVIECTDGKIDIKIVEPDMKTVCYHKQMRRVLHRVYACSQIENAILSAHYCFWKKLDSVSSCCIDARSERFSGFLEFLLQQEGISNFSVLWAERDCIKQLPFEQMRVLVLWAIRRSMPAGSELLQTVYGWIRSYETIDHIAYPRDWFSVKVPMCN